jgi:hypothetical protein
MPRPTKRRFSVARQSTRPKIIGSKRFGSSSYSESPALKLMFVHYQSNSDDIYIEQRAQRNVDRPDKCNLVTATKSSKKLVLMF